MNRVRAACLAGLAGIGALLPAACATAGYDTTADNTADITARSARAEQTAGAQLPAVSGGTLGVIVVDGRGMPLSRFAGDGNAPATSNCADSCAESWPPVLV